MEKNLFLKQTRLAWIQRSSWKGVNHYAQLRNSFKVWAQAFSYIKWEKTYGPRTYNIASDFEMQ